MLVGSLIANTPINNIGYVTNDYNYATVTAGNIATSNKSITANNNYYVGPFIAQESITVNRLVTEVDTGTGSADSLIMGIYEYRRELPGLVGGLVGTNNAVVSIQTSGTKEAVVSCPLVRGVPYWLVLCADAGVSLRAFPNSNNVRMSSKDITDPSTLIKESFTYTGTLPATSGAVSGDRTTEQQPFIAFRVV